MDTFRTSRNGALSGNVQALSVLLISGKRDVQDGRAERTRQLRTFRVLHNTRSAIARNDVFLAGDEGSRH
jgi:hypothetical protein